MASNKRPACARKRDPLSASAEMRRRLILQRPLENDDGAGGATVTWADVATLWVALRPLREDALAYADAEAGFILWRAGLRWRADVRAGWRLRRPAGGHLDILAVWDPDGRRRRLVCRCLERPL